MTKSQRVLVAVNMALLAALALASMTRGQSAAGNQPQRGRGQYVAVPAKAQGLSTGVLYIADTANEELVALRWDKGTGSFEVVGFRDLVNDVAAGGKGR
ncbi:MAG: hypothetical protein IBJ18_09240 [Phycisphaerales bacterium]|nr:hypothetical protein [Phycisphaerales bacterium]